MNWNIWEPWYIWIVGALGISMNMDFEAAQRLDAMIRNRACNASAVRGLVEKKLAIIVGAGPSVEKSIDVVLKGKGCAVIAADGACSKLLEVGVTPDIIVTDLDGNVDDIYEGWRRGAYIVVHAHGDNIQALEEHAKKFNKRVIGTTQTRPIGCLHNFGGFTDGDRAVFMALELNCAAILMIGMDLSKKVGKYSKPWLSEDEMAWPFKYAKFMIARKLLSWASRLYSKPILRVVVNGYDCGEQIDGVRDINLNEVNEVIDEVYLMNLLA
ncbi:MAG: 6-hydroxymethylpterin diphosphokinase MptE-like protein [Candidatus Nezhaarchaeales archaeon]|nr:MAG: 6-hydroxymethyl-7,8-dihydropterin pyrophosphokinase [Candidatus Nezhaarchaeota archaeon WYZ-LMO8]